MDPLELFAVSAPGLEAITASEVRALGVRPTVEPGGVSFSGRLDSLYAANLHLRTASRVLLRLGRFEATAFHELERNARKVDWRRTIAPGDPVRVRVTCRKSRLYHSDAVAERILAAIDRTVGGVSPAVEGRDGDESDDVPPVEGGEGEPGPLIVVRIAHDRVELSADTSGALLHLRGYRKAVGKAPLRETLAAAMLLAAGWDPDSPLVDPMCGSGTIAIEGALLARRLAPGLGRRFAFQRWPDFDSAVWDGLVERAQAASLSAAPAPIVAADRDAGAIAATSANAQRAGVAPDVEAVRAPLSALLAPAASGGGRPGAIVTNPPYGTRLGEPHALRDLYARLGQVCRAGFPGWIVALLSADRRLEGQLRLELAERFRTHNGGIPVRFLVGSVPR